MKDYRQKQLENNFFFFFCLMATKCFVQGPAVLEISAVKFTLNIITNPKKIFKKNKVENINIIYLENLIQNMAGTC